MFVLRSHHIDRRLIAPAEGTVTSALGSCVSSLGIDGGASTWWVAALSFPTCWLGSRG